MAGLTVSLVDAQDYAKKQFTVDSERKTFAHLDAKDALPAPASSQEPKFEWEVPVAHVALGKTFAEAALGLNGQWREISGDRQISGAMYALASLLRKPPPWKSLLRLPLHPRPMQPARPNPPARPALLLKFPPKARRSQVLLKRLLSLSSVRRLQAMRVKRS